MVLLMMSLHSMLATFVVWFAALPAEAGTPGSGKARVAMPLPAGALYRIGTPEVRFAAVHPAIFASPDGRRIALADDDDRLVIRSVATGAEIAKVPFDWSYDVCVMFAPDGRSLAYNRGGQLWLRDTDRSGRTAALGPAALSAVFAADGKTLTAVQADDDSDPARLTVRRWDVAAGKSLAAWHWSSGRSWRDFSIAASLAPDGTMLAILESDRSDPDAPRQTVYLRDAKGGTELRHWSVTPPAIERLVFSADSRFVAAGSRDSTVRVWETATGNRLARWRTDPTAAVAYRRFHVGFAAGALVCTGRDGLALGLAHREAPARISTYQRPLCRRRRGQGFGGAGCDGRAARAGPGDRARPVSPGGSGGLRRGVARFPRHRVGQRQRHPRA